MTFNTTGSIATHIVENIPSVSAGISGNMIEIVDMARQHVANYTGQTIDPSGIQPQFEPAIVAFAKADTIDFINADGTDLSLAELSIGGNGQTMSAEQWRMMGENYLKSLGKRAYFVRSLS